MSLKPTDVLVEYIMNLNDILGIDECSRHVREELYQLSVEQLELYIQELENELDESAIV